MTSSTSDSVPKDQQDALNAILDAALDELDDDDDDDHKDEQVLHSNDKEEPVAAAATAQSTTISEAPECMPFRNDNAHDDAEAMAVLESFCKQLEVDLLANELAAAEGVQQQQQQDTTSTRNAPPSARVVHAGPPRPPSTNASTSSSAPAATNSVNSTIESLLENMAKANVPHEIVNEEDAAMLDSIMKEFENMLPNMGSGGDVDSSTEDALVNGMMQQLLSKELMYEPMKQVCEKFPPWLQQHKKDMTHEEYSRRSKQFQCFKDLVLVYETEPSNVDKLMQLMEQVQEYGQPPVEIVKEIAPELQLDEHGMPIQGVGNEEECCIM